MWTLILPTVQHLASLDAMNWGRDEMVIPVAIDVTSVDAMAGTIIEVLVKLRCCQQQPEIQSPNTA